MNPIFIRVLVLAVTFGVGAVSGTAFGWRQGALEVRSAWNEAKQAQSELEKNTLQAQNEKVLTAERKTVKKSNAAAIVLHKSNKGIDDAEAAALKRLDTDRLRLPNSDSANAGSDTVPGTAACPSADRDGTAPGLFKPDAEFLIRFAGEADRVVNQLNACQRLLEIEREQ